MALSLGDSLRAGEQVLFRQLDQEAVLLDLKSGTYFGLNEVGARAWELILEHGQLSRVLGVLLQNSRPNPKSSNAICWSWPGISSRGSSRW